MKNQNIFKGQRETRKEQLDSVPLEHLEKVFIIDFFKSLPVESLKKLIDYKIIDFENIKPESRGDLELFYILREKNVILQTCELILDVD